MGKKSKKKRGKQKALTQLSLTGEKDQSIPPVVQEYQGHGPPEKLDESSEDRSSSVTSHSGRSASPHELEEEPKPTRREAEEAGQNIVQLPYESGSVCQQLEEGGSFGQRPDERGSISQRLEEGGTVGQLPNERRSISQRLEEGGSFGQRPDERGSISQQLEEGGSVGQLPNEKGNVCQRREEGGTVVQQPDESGSSSQQLEESETVVQQPDETGSTSQQQEEGGSAGQPLEDHRNIDQRLEEAAAKSSLSVLNVKSILHHVLKDRRVLALVQRRVAEEEGRELSREWEADIVPYEPKLTRSHVRQAVASSVSRGAVSPEKIASLSRISHTPGKATGSGNQVIHPLLDVTFSEESSDEEYNPTADMSEEESEGEESEEERGDTPLCNAGQAEVPPIEEEQDGVKSTGTISTVLPGSASQVAPLPCVAEAQMESSSSAAPEFSGPSQTLASTSATFQAVSTMPASTVTQTSSTSSSTMMQRTETVTSDECILPASSVPSLLPDTQSSTFTAPQPTTPPAPHPATPPAPHPTIPPAPHPATPPAPHPTTPPAPHPTIPPALHPATPPAPLPTTPPAPLPTTPPAIVTASRSEDLMVQEAAALLASLSDTILSPMKIYIPQGQEDSVEPHIPTSTEEDEGLIATRTRSKHPLTDTSISAIEASFVPPDVEEPPTPMELDDEELEWQQWLHDLMNPSDSPVSADVRGEGGVVSSHDVGGDIAGEEIEDGDDVDYNYLADQQPEEEKEEFRNDRAVKIPHQARRLLDYCIFVPSSEKEVDDLLNELLNPSDDGLGGLLLSSDGIDLTSAYLLESLGLQPPLLMQSSVLGTPQRAAHSSDPSIMHTVSGDRDEQVENVGCQLSTDQTVQVWTQIQQHLQLLMQTFVLSRFEPSLVFLSQISAQAIEEITKWCDEAKEGKNSPVWHIPNLEEAKGLMQALDPNNKEVELVPAIGNPTRIPETVQDIIFGHQMFWNYPQLLPGVGFAALSKENASGSKYFTTEEDHLLVLGMDHYGPSSWKLIQENILPTKSVKQLQLRVKNQCSKRTGENVIKYYKRTKEVKIPYRDNGEEKTPDLPQWTLQYHKKRTEKERLLEKRREKETDDSCKMARLLDGVLKPPAKPLTLKAKAVGVPTNVRNSEAGSTYASIGMQASSGSKRNLANRLQEAESEAKRLRLGSEDQSHSTSTSKSLAEGPRGRPKRKRGQPQQKIEQQMSSTSPSVLESCSYPLHQSPVNVLQPLNSVGDGYHSASTSPVKRTSNSKGDMEQLLWAAGLEACDPTARYAYNYLTEVKGTLLSSKQGTYEEFLKALLDAKKQRWKPSKLFHKVQQILQPWPHLIKLFTEFMEPQDCLEAEVMADKYELESVKAFVETLQTKFAGAPLQLEDAIERIRKLNTPSITREKVLSSLLPLIDAHEELTEELKRILFQLAPPPRTEDVYEEITIGSDCEKEPDEFEEVLLSDSPPPRMVEFDRKIRTTPTAMKTLPMQPENIKKSELLEERCELQPDKGKNLEGSLSSHAVAAPGDPKDDDQEHGQTPVDMAKSLSFIPVSDTHHRMLSDKTAPITSGNAGRSESESDSNLEGVPKGSPTPWSRNEDRVVLQYCLHEKTEASLKNIAAQLNRTETEVQQRYKELLVLFRSSYSDSQSL